MFRYAKHSLPLVMYRRLFTLVWLFILRHSTYQTVEFVTLLPQKSSGRLNAFLSDSYHLFGRKANLLKVKDNDVPMRPVEDIYKKPMFDRTKILEVVERVIEKSMEVEDEDDIKKYNPNDNEEYCQLLAQNIRDKVKELNMMRCRIVCLVSIVEKKHQGLTYKMKYCLDTQMDGYINYYYETPNFYILVTVILVFKD